MILHFIPMTPFPGLEPTIRNSASKGDFQGNHDSDAHQYCHGFEYSSRTVAVKSNSVRLLGAYPLALNTQCFCCSFPLLDARSYLADFRSVHMDVSVNLGVEKTDSSGNLLTHSDRPPGS